MSKKISKRLSANDIGSTGAHQAGILVPKQKEILEFFPSLDSKQKNPRQTLVIRELNDRTRWEFNLIYYNNKFFGGTRNEFRLTCMTQYLRSVDSKIGDELVFSKDENGSIFIECVREDLNKPTLTSDGVLILSGGWKIINT